MSFFKANNLYDIIMNNIPEGKKMLDSQYYYGLFTRSYIFWDVECRGNLLSDVIYYE